MISSDIERRPETEFEKLLSKIFLPEPDENKEEDVISRIKNLNCFEVLGFEVHDRSSALPSDSEIRTRYRALSRFAHPDKLYTAQGIQPKITSEIQKTLFAKIDNAKDALKDDGAEAYIEALHTPLVEKDVFVADLVQFLWQIPRGQPLSYKKFARDIIVGHRYEDPDPVIEEFESALREDTPITKDLARKLKIIIYQSEAGNDRTRGRESKLAELFCRIPDNLFYLKEKKITLLNI